MDDYTSCGCFGIVRCNPNVSSEGKIANTRILIVSLENEAERSQWQLPGGYGLTDPNPPLEGACESLLNYLRERFNLELIVGRTLRDGKPTVYDDVFPHSFHFFCFELVSAREVPSNRFCLGDGIRAVGLFSPAQVRHFLNAGVILPLHVEPLQEFLVELEDGEVRVPLAEVAA